MWSLLLGYGLIALRLVLHCPISDYADLQDCVRQGFSQTTDLLDIQGRLCLKMKAPGLSLAELEVESCLIQV
jgi:hypothetical protein